MQIECEYCGEPFDGKRSNRKYCSDNCKQMAYYKRNGLVLANFSGLNQEEINESVKDVKYDSTVKYNPTMISDAMLNAIADRLLILLEERIAKRITDKSDTVTTDNVKDEVNVKQYLTENDVQSSLVCSSQPFMGISFQSNHVTVKDDVSATVKHDSHINNRPAVKRDEISVRQKRKRKNKHQPLAPVSLQNEESEPVSEIPTDEAKVQELELSLRNFTVSDGSALPDESSVPENDAVINEAINDNSPSQEKKLEIVKYEWVDSPFINLIDDYLSNDYTDLSNYRHKKEYIKVLECFKCLIWTLVQMSNRPKVDPETFFKVATAFSYLTQSAAFKEVPKNYPYYSMIVEMTEKICAVAESKRVSEFKLSAKRKAILIAVRYQMGGFIKDLKFSELFQ